MTPNFCPIIPKGAKNKAPIPQLNPCITPLTTPVYFGIAFCAWVNIIPTDKSIKKPVNINKITAKYLL